MPYTPAITFVTNTAISATDINTQDDGLRKYVNSAISPEDIRSGSVGTPEIVRGEYFGVTRDHQFTMGDMYSNFQDTSTLERSYFSAMTKNVYSFVSMSQYVPVTGTGKQFYLEAPAIVIYHAWFQPVMETNHSNYNEVGDYATLAVHVDDVIKSEATRHRTFREDGAAHVIPVGSGKAASMRRPFPLSTLINFSSASYTIPGWHTLDVRADAQSSQGFVSAKNVSIEVIYTENT